MYSVPGEGNPRRRPTPRGGLDSVQTDLLILVPTKHGFWSAPMAREHSATMLETGF